MQKIVAYVGPTCTGKTTALQKTLELEKEDLNTPETLLLVLDNEIKSYRKILPNATYMKEMDAIGKKFETIIIDPAEYTGKLDLGMAKNVYLASQTPLDLVAKA